MYLNFIYRGTVLKMSNMAIPDNVYNWIRNFLDNRSHCTKFHLEFSNFLNILASVIQGSVIGPASYAIHAGDLRPITDGNDMVKYADDTYLVVPEVNSASVSYTHLTLPTNREV